MTDLLISWTVTIAEGRAFIQQDVDVSCIVRKWGDNPSVEIRSIWLDGLNLALANNPVLRALGFHALQALENDEALQSRAIAEAGYTYHNPSGDPSCGRWRHA